MNSSVHTNPHSCCRVSLRECTTVSLCSLLRTGYSLLDSYLFCVMRFGSKSSQLILIQTNWYSWPSHHPRFFWHDGNLIQKTKLKVQVFVPLLYIIYGCLVSTPTCGTARCRRCSPAGGSGGRAWRRSPSWAAGSCYTSRPGSGT